MALFLCFIRKNGRSPSAAQLTEEAPGSLRTKRHELKRPQSG
ncbi:hypothetical protein JMJ77_0001436, partial [Colletotrichum scovillei]